MTTTFGNKGTKSDRHVHVSYTICICNHAQCVHVSYTICTGIIYNMYMYHTQYVHVSYIHFVYVTYTIWTCIMHNMYMYHIQYVHVSYSITNKCVFFPYSTTFGNKGAKSDRQTIVQMNSVLKYNAA